MGIVVKNNRVSNAGGHGYSFNGVVPEVFEGNIAENVGGNGVHIEITADQILAQLTLPTGVDRSEIDPKELAELLSVIRTLDFEHKRDAVTKSSLLSKLTKGTFDVSSFVSSLITISADPRSQLIIQGLLS